MEKYRLHVYFRHYIHDYDTLMRYKKIVNRVNRATKLVDFDMNIIVNYDPGMPQGIKDEVTAISQKLIEENIEFSIKIGRGAGTAMFNSIGEALGNMSVDMEDEMVCVIDGDSYPIDDLHFLRRVKRLSDSVHRNGAIMGLAQKSKVILGGGQTEVYREINEMYLALAIRGKVSVKKSVELNVPDAYAEFGDPVPGFYVFNIAHPKFNDLYERLQDDMRNADITKYAGDHYIVLAASQLGNIETDIVPLEDNPPGSFKIDNIGNMSHEIGKTSLRKVYLHTVQSEENRKTLEKYYAPEAVEKVRKIILDAMLTRD